MLVPCIRCKFILWRRVYFTLLLGTFCFCLRQYEVIFTSFIFQLLGATKLQFFSTYNVTLYSMWNAIHQQCHHYSDEQCIISSFGLLTTATQLTIKLWNVTLMVISTWFLYYIVQLKMGVWLLRETNMEKLILRVSFLDGKFR